MINFRSLGKLDVEIFEKKFGKLQTDEIIITNERENHIKMRHPVDYELFETYGKNCVANPDIIIVDLKNDGTVFMIKKLNKTNLNIVIRVVLEKDNYELKNSVMTCYRIRDRNLIKLIEKNELLYKIE